VAVERLQPSNRTIVGVAVLLLALVLLGVGLHHLIATGTCSTTGYNEYGPVPHCPKGVGWWAGLLVGGIFLSIAGGVIAGGSGPLLIAPVTFCAVGAGASSVALDSGVSSGNRTFGLIFGGFFLVAGLTWIAIVARAALRGRRGAGASSFLSPLGTAPTVTTDPITQSSLASSSPSGALGRLTVALIVWIAAGAGAAALSSAVVGHVRDQQRQAARAAVAQGGGSTSAPSRTFDATSVTPTDARSLFRGSNFARVLGIARQHLGGRADVQQLRVAPGEALLTVLQGDQARQVSIKANGDYVVVASGTISGTTQVFYLSQIEADVPGALARRIAAHGHVPRGRLDYMLVLTDPVAHRHRWLVYPIGGRTHFQADTASGPIEEFGPSGVRTLAG
jgi:hypothetical protein